MAVRKHARKWMTPGLILLLGIFVAVALTSAIGSMENREFEAVSEQLVTDLEDGYADLVALVRLYGAATEIGIESSDLQDATTLAPSRVAGSIRALSYARAGAPPTTFGFIPSDVTLLASDSEGELSHVTEDRYLVVLSTGPNETRSLFSIEAFTDTVADAARPLVDLELSDAGTIVSDGTSGRTDFRIERDLVLGDHRFQATFAAGPAYSGSGARWAGVTTVLFSIAMAALAWKVRTSVEARVSAEAERAEMAEGINAGKDRFLASVAHELRTPLSVIMGTTMELLANAAVHSATEQREMLEMAAHESVSIRDTIEDMLVTARLASGDLAIHRRRADIVELVENHVSTIDSRPGLSIEVESSAIGEVMVDPGRWVHAFRNLMSNAVDHAHSNIRVTFDQTRAVTRVAVSDDGPGLPDGLVEYAFRPYSALDHVSTTPAPVGVGLSVARGLARTLGGDVTYRRSGAISLFTLTVPTNPDDDERSPGLAPVPSIAS